MNLGDIFSNLYLSEYGFKRLCFEYKDAKGELISSHTRFKIVEEIGMERLILSPDKNNQLVLSFKKEIKLVEDNVVTFEDDTSLVFYFCLEIDMEKFC